MNRSLSRTFISFLAACVLLAGGLAAQNTPQIAYLRFEEGCGTSTLNEASTGYSDCTLTGAATFVNNGFITPNSAAQMGSGAGTDRCDTGIAIPTSGDWTIEALISYTTTSSALGYLFGVASGSFRCFRNGAAGTDALVLRGIPIDVPLTGLSSGPSFATHHIAFVYDDGTQTITPYLNGVAQAAVAQGTAVTLPAGSLVVGGHFTSNSWNGTVDEFRFWNVARSPQEIAGFMWQIPEPGPVLTINDHVPHGFHRSIEIGCPFDVSIRIDGQGTTPLPLLLLAGVGSSCGGYPTPWGGSIEIGAPLIVADGFNPISALDFYAKTNFEIAFRAPAWAAGAAGPSVQAIVADGSNAPFFLKNTAWGEPSFVNSTVTGYVSLGDDDFVAHTLASGSIEFGGTSYTTVFLGSNGQVTFGAGDNDFSPSTAEFFAGFQGAGTSTPNPGVAAVWGDYAMAGVDDDITVCESGSSSQPDVVVGYNNQVHWDSGANAGSWDCAFTHNGPENIVTLDVAGYKPRVDGVDKDPIIGVSDGDDTDGGIDSIINFSLQNYWITSSAASSESICEQFSSSSGSLDVDLLHFIETSPFHWLVLVDL